MGNAPRPVPVAAVSGQADTANDLFYSPYLFLFLLGMQVPFFLWIGLFGLRSPLPHEIWFAKACGWALLFNFIREIVKRYLGIVDEIIILG